MKSLDVRLPSKKGCSYRIFLGPDAIQDLPKCLEAAQGFHAVALIADQRVLALHGKTVLRLLKSSCERLLVCEVPSGERSKSRRMKERIEDRMLEAGIGRDGGIVAFGGGVIGDLAGFVAATYLRGIPFIQVPTTLLAQVDSSIGGKVGVNTRQGKNLIGAFHQPVAVLADTALLNTLPKRQFRSGMAELIKHAIIGDPRLFHDLERDMEDLLRTPQDALPSALLRSIRVKADVVAQDEKEGGLRKILNWGHTVGHAVEAMSRYRLFHGEALSIGMAVEAAWCCRSGWLSQEDAQREIRLLERTGLPTCIPRGMDPLTLLGWTRADKKARAGRVEYPVHDRIGSMAPLSGQYSIPVADKDVLEAIKARGSRSSGL